MGVMKALRLSMLVWLPAVLIAGTSLVQAATPAAPVPQGVAQGLEISPPVKELQADPGQTVSFPIRLRDVSSGALVVKATADDFGAKGENGDPKILLDEKEASRYSLKFWVQPLPNLTLVPQEVKTVTVNIAVPANAEPGGHYGVIRFTGTPPELEGTGVSLTASIGALVLLRVSGDIKEQLEVAEFYTSKPGKSGPSRASFFETGPINFTERLRNTGSVHSKPAGYVDVYNTFHKRIARLPVSNPARNVLPDSIRRFEQQLETKSLFGRYTAQMNASYGNNKKLSSQTISFWVVPYKLLAVILFALIVLIVLLRQGVRRYNQWIIRQASRRQ
jgi:hypothetical protein